jgi:hypothetical protein
VSAPFRVGLFVLAIVAVALAAAAAGLAVPSLHESPGDSHGHAGEGHAPEDARSAAGPAVTDGGLTFTIDRPVVAAPGPTALRMRLSDPRGRPVTDLDVTYERPFHLILASRDLAHFRHAHPRMLDDGSWAAEIDVPAAGVYRAFADISLAGRPHTLATDLFVNGPFAATPLPAASGRAQGDGYVATVVAREDTQRETRLTYRVTREGRPALDIAPYLGSSAHVVALREGDLAFVHAHAEATEDDGELRVAVDATSPGRYRVFVQFLHDGAVRTVAHTLAVAR